MSAPRPACPPPAVSDLALERYRLGELPPTRMAEIEDSLQNDSTLRARLEAIGQADEQARRHYSPDDIARDVRARLSRPPSRPSQRRPTIVWFVPAVTVVLLAVIIGPWGRVWRSEIDPAASGAEGDRPKGADVSLFVYRNTVTGVERLTDDDVARTGDLVRLGYRVTDPVYGAIVSVDGRGLLTRHLPDDGALAVRLEPASTVLLNGSFELDDAPEVERFFLITAAEPFDLAPVLDALRAAAANGTPDTADLHLSSRFTATAFSLRKDSRP